MSVRATDWPAVRRLDGWPAIAAMLAAALALTVPLQGLGVDQWLADRVYAWEGGRWAWREAWWTSRLLHEGGRLLTVLAGAALAAVLLLDRRLHVLSARWRSAAGYLLVTVGLCAVLVAMLKRITGVDCPWDLLRYGGTRDWALPFAGAGACFPAGHAGAGYAWVGLYFALGHAAPRWRGWGLAVGLILGTVFGVTQQLRGAHFLSHDVWALAVCASVAIGVARYWPGWTALSAHARR
ncbi:phosphatase PAP2 family protein [Luteimonas sp. 9C]|uniref:phosphatase PAP2 family protein n=1 Tax=Luteimonas sp. 9C TaxID=2653148 RepID=UPI0013573893|nr:phosphatase PAP2 family protein [Luteimonas sp. 9C]